MRRSQGSAKTREIRTGDTRIEGKSDSAFIRTLEAYLPKMVTDEEIAAFIRENIDFSVFKNTMQAMGPIMKHFGKTADGHAVKRVLQSLGDPESKS